MPFFQAESDPTKLRNMYSEAVKDLTVLRRSAIVNQLYGGWTLAVEKQERGNEPEDISTRSKS
jgi:hypothetical protein